MKRVLLLCSANSIRSQLAEGLWRDVGGAEWEVHSAGVSGVGQVHPLVVAALHELGVDATDQYSKSVDQFLADSFEAVVVLSEEARRLAPSLFPGARVLDWVVRDPLVHQPYPDRRSSFLALARDLAQKIQDFIGTAEGE